MALRDALPPAWFAALAVLGGLVAGVLWGRTSPSGGSRPSTPPATSGLPAPSSVGAPVAVTGPRTPALPGAPPTEIAREMEEALRLTFAGDAADPATRPAQDAAFARVKDLVARWAAASKRDPLASVAWWRAALSRTLLPAEPGPPGWTEVEVEFLGDWVSVLVSAPEGGAGGPLPVVLVILEANPDPREFLRRHYGPLLDSHAVVAVLLREPRQDPVDPVVQDPRIALLGVLRAAKRWPLDRDRVVVDGFGRGARLAAHLAADSARQFSGAVLRYPPEIGEPAENLAMNPLLLLGPEAPEEPMAGALAAAGKAQPSALVVAAGDAAFGFPSAADTVQKWIAALPPRSAADPRRAFAFASVTGDRFVTWGHWFVVKRTAGFGPGRTVRVRIARDRERNALVLRTEEVAEILLLLSDEDLDLDRPVKVIVNGVLVAERKVERSLDTMRTWAGAGERTLFAPAEWTVRVGE